MIELVDTPDPGARIKVIGAGGCGGNAVSHMIKQGLHGVDFIAVNTDSQALANSTAPMRMQIGSVLTRGRGTGGNPEYRTQGRARGRGAAARGAQGGRDGIRHRRDGRRHGHRLGPGARADRQRERRFDGLGVVTKPFQFEGSRRMSQADEGLRELKDASRHADHDSQSAPALHRQPHHFAARGLPEGRRRPAPGRARYLGAGHRPWIDQPGLRRRAFDHGRDGPCDDGRGERDRREPRGRSGAARDSRARCSRTFRSRARADC